MQIKNTWQVWLIVLVLMKAVTTLEAVPRTQPADMKPAQKDELQKQIAPVLKKALHYLAAAQADDGGWQGFSPASDPAITALVAKAFIQYPDFGSQHPSVKRAVNFIIGFQQPDGGIYNPKTGYANYTTSIALMTLVAMKDAKLQPYIKAAQNYLKNNQWIRGKKDLDGVPVDPGHAWYGGAGYSDCKRPDLSNTQMMIEALHASGLPKDDPVYRKAVKFISRCQMMKQTNDQPFADHADQGGFIYSPAYGGESKAGTITAEGQTRLRCYGSMTYAGFKSMLYANVKRDDVRVQRAWDWIRRHYTLDSNPNMPGAKSKEGLFYFYQVFAKALRAWDESIVVDGEGRRHDWRSELCQKLLSLQRPDGSWINTADRWHEDHPYLVTAYAVLALQTAIE